MVLREVGVANPYFALVTKCLLDGHPYDRINSAPTSDILVSKDPVAVGHRS